MKLIHIFLSLLLIAGSGSAMAKGTRLLHVDQWTSINLSGEFGIDVKINADSAGVVRVIASDKDYEYLILNSKGGTLNVGSKDRKSTASYGKKNVRIIAYTAGKIEALVLGGSGYINIPAVNGKDDLNISLRGSGDVNIGSVNIPELNISLMGSGDIEIDKTNVSGSINAQLSGNGDIELKKIKAAEVNAVLKGSGDIDLAGKSREVNLVLEGSGDIDAARLNADEINAVAKGTGGITLGNAKKINAIGDNVRQSKKIKH